jgi:hypothetical protein
MLSGPLKGSSPDVERMFSDGTPTLSFDGRTLVFASNRPGGVGGNDLWISTRVPR